MGMQLQQAQIRSQTDTVILYCKTPERALPFISSWILCRECSQCSRRKTNDRRCKSGCVTHIDSCGDSVVVQLNISDVSITTAVNHLNSEMLHTPDTQSTMKSSTTNTSGRGGGSGICHKGHLGRGDRQIKYLRPRQCRENNIIVGSRLGETAFRG